MYAQRLIRHPSSMKERMDDEALRSAKLLTRTDAEVVVKVGDVLKYSAHVHGSIGKKYKLEYDEEAFDVWCKTQYDNPGRDGRVKPGGDAGVETSIFTAKKPGEYEIKVLKMDKTKVRNVTTYKVTVIDGEEDFRKDSIADFGIVD